MRVIGVYAVRYARTGGLTCTMSAYIYVNNTGNFDEKKSKNVNGFRLFLLSLIKILGYQSYTLGNRN